MEDDLFREARVRLGRVRSGLGPWTAAGRDRDRNVIRSDAIRRRNDRAPARRWFAFAGVEHRRNHLPEPSPVKIAGYSGSQFDGNVWGMFGHVFVPFTQKTHGASPADSHRLDKGEQFRIVALNVHGKTVVLFLESVTLPADQFPAFLTSANKLLKSLRFPG